MNAWLIKPIRRAVFFLLPALLSFTAGAIGAQSPERNHTEDRQELRGQIPIGTVLPVRLNQSLSLKKTKPGQCISARIMQDVPLPNGEKIAAGSGVVGMVVSVEPAAQGEGGKASFRFDKVVTRKTSFPVATGLRALASFLEVQDAQTPELSLGFGTPYNWADRHQIGGDAVYGVGGPVTNRWNEHVGTAVYDGVLVHVRPRPESGCRGALDEEDRLQALWVFSADACGVYGIEGLQIAHAGQSEPIGEIQLTLAKGNVMVHSASAMLLRVVR